MKKTTKTTYQLFENDKEALECIFVCVLPFIIFAALYLLIEVILFGWLLK